MDLPQNPERSGSSKMAIVNGFSICEERQQQY